MSKKSNNASSLPEFAEDINIKNPALDYPNARSIQRHFILNIGETNTGKTYTALQALKTASAGVYLAPLRLLAMEIQDTLLADNVLCSMLTGEEENIIEGSTIMSSTVEKIDLNKKYEVGVIDECQMISDASRGGSWTKAILGLAAETIYLCMSPDAEEICIKLIRMCGDTFEVNYYQRRTPLTYIGQIRLNQLQKHDAVILFSRRDVLRFAEEVKKFNLKPSVVYGALPYKARKHQVEMYDTGETDIIVSTDAIGMGINLPIRRVLFAQTDKYDGTEIRDLFPHEVKQIGGRAGRLGKFDEGFVGLVSPYYISENIIVNGLNSKNKPINTAYIPFPEEVIKSSDKKLSTILIEWSKIKYPKIFKQQDLTMTIEKVLYLEKQYENLDRYTALKLATVMFDEKEEALFHKWQQHVDAFMNNIKKELPLIYGNDLKEWELKHKELSLYYSFNKTMGLDIDIAKITELKEEIIDKINYLLIKTNTKKPQKKKCRNCGRKLPAGFLYDICDWCHYYMR